MQMTDNELILALSDLFDKKLSPIHARLDHIESDVHQVNEKIHNMELRIDNDIVPRMQNIESCYTSTYNRYKTGVSEIDAMKMDISVMKKAMIERK